MKTPKYTFLLPAFKAKFLAEMLESIKNQTYTDFKVLISDDCSPEPIREVCAPYLTDPRFSYRRNEENMGSKSLVSHWNLLVDMCDTEFLIMASDDDEYAPTFLEEIDKLQEKYPQVDLLRARVKSIDGNNKLRAKDAIYEEYVDQLDFLYQKHYNNALTCVPCYVFRTRKMKEIGGFFLLPLAWHSDDATALLMSQNGAANTSNMLISFRTSTINISGSRINKKTAYLKGVATLLYDKFYKEYVESLKNKYPINPYVNRQILRSNEMHSDHCCKMTRVFCSLTSFANMIRLCKIGNIPVIKGVYYYFRLKL